MLDLYTYSLTTNEAVGVTVRAAAGVSVRAAARVATGQLQGRLQE